MRSSTSATASRSASTRSTKPNTCRRPLAARDILALSSNIGTSQIALRSGGERQKEFLTKMGLLARLHTELPEARKPLYPANWGTIETATISFGHGISVSPIDVRSGGRRSGEWRAQNRADVPEASGRRSRRTTHQARNQREDARASALCRHQRHGQESGHRGIRRRRQDRFGAKAEAEWSWLHARLDHVVLRCIFPSTIRTISSSC